MRVLFLILFLVIGCAEDERVQTVESKDHESHIVCFELNSVCEEILYEYWANTDGTVAFIYDSELDCDNATPVKILDDGSYFWLRDNAILFLDTNTGGIWAHALLF